MANLPDADIYVATQSFATLLDGKPITVRKGVTRVRRGHKLLKGRESMFAPLEVQFDVEQATSAPGEKRAGAPAPKPAPAAAPEPKPEP
jgi:hypothetical protein